MGPLSSNIGRGDIVGRGINSGGRPRNEHESAVNKLEHKVVSKSSYNSYNGYSESEHSETERSESKHSESGHNDSEHSGIEHSDSESTVTPRGWGGRMVSLTMSCTLVVS